MTFLEGFRLAARGIRSNLLRSVLTMLGVIIGVGSVIAMVSLGQGASAEVTQRIANMGSNLLMVQPGRAVVRTSGGTRVAVLTVAHEQAIAAHASAVAATAPELSQTANIRTESGSHEFQVIGTTASYLEIRNTSIVSGRMFSDEEKRAADRVVVLGANPAAELFPHTDPVGETLRINQRTFLIIGVLEAKGDSAMMSADDSILVPVTTAEKRLFGTDALRMINVKAVSSDHIDAAEAQIERILSPMLPEGAEIRITNMQQMLDTMEETSMTFTLLLAGIAGVSLLVGGIGIMNIMLVSVTERTKEIGIRRAIGGTPKDILVQFTLEAIFLSSLGGLIGIAAGFSGAQLLSQAMGWAVMFSGSAAVLGFGTAVTIGLFFGIWPASRAAALDPILALRHDM